MLGLKESCYIPLYSRRAEIGRRQVRPRIRFMRASMGRLHFRAANESNQPAKGSDTWINSARSETTYPADARWVNRVFRVSRKRERCDCDVI